jgi:ethanolamine ammonia-lyase large subunit
MGKLLGLPMGVDICYTNHADADQNSTDNLLLLLAAAGCNYIMGVPGSDDVMLNYQSTSYQDGLATRRLFGLRPAPEFMAWLEHHGLPTGSTAVEGRRSAIDDGSAQRLMLESVSNVLERAAGFA